MIFEAYYYPNLVKKAKWILRTCDSFQRNKTYTTNIFAKTQSTTLIRPGELLSIDFIGWYPMGRGGVKHALAMIDTFSEYVKIYAVWNVTRWIATKKHFKVYIPKQGVVGRVVADHGSIHKTKVATDLYRGRNKTCQIIYSTPPRQHGWANSQK